MPCHLLPTMKTNRNTPPQKSTLRLPATYKEAAQESRDNQLNISLTDKEMLALMTLADSEGRKPAIMGRQLLLVALATCVIDRRKPKLLAKVRVKIDQPKVVRRRAVPIVKSKSKPRVRTVRVRAEQLSRPFTVLR